MTLEQLADSLPNGFHDAEVEELVWNFRTNSASFSMTLWVPEEISENPETYRAGQLEVKDIVFIAIDPPFPSDLGPKPYKAKPETLSIDGMTTNADIFPNLSVLRQKIPADVEIYSLYVANWNSFIHIAAKEACLTWLGEREVRGKNSHKRGLAE